MDIKDVLTGLDGKVDAIAEKIAPAVAAHNNATDAHPDIRSALKTLDDKIDTIQSGTALQWLD